MLQVPQGVEEQSPSGKARAPAMRVAEESLDGVRQADLANARLAGDKRAELDAAAMDPIAHRHGKSALFRERVDHSDVLSEPTP